MTIPADRFLRRCCLPAGPALIAAAALFSGAWAPASFADVIWVGSGTGRGFRQEVDIVGVESDQLVYLVNGNRATSSLSRIQQIELEGEAAFNQAEQAFVSGEFIPAAEAYLLPARRHEKPWVQLRSAERVVEAASRGNRFDLAVSGYIQLTLISPQLAATRVPGITEQTEPLQLEKAAGELQQVLDEGVSPAQARPLLALLLTVHNRRGDAQAAGRVLERLGRVMGPDSAQLDPELFGQVLIGRANLAISRGQYEEAVQHVRQGRELFTQPRQQSDALMILANVAERRARDDRDRLLDAAFEYMKVVAHFRREEEAPNVAEALWRVGQIHERVGLAEAAAVIYRDLAASYPRSPFAAEAQKRLSEMGD